MTIIGNGVNKAGQGTTIWTALATTELANFKTSAQHWRKSLYSVQGGISEGLIKIQESDILPSFPTMDSFCDYKNKGKTHDRKA